MQKFKAGQKVRVKEAGSVHHYLKNGSEATIVDYHSKYNSVDRYRVDGVDCRGDEIHQILGEDQIELLIDFTKPVFTAEGTPVQIVTTNGRDEKYPVLGYEGNAKTLSKFSLDGKNKNRVARRHLTDTQVAGAPVKEVFVFVNLFDIGLLPNGPRHNVKHGGAIGNGRFNSVKEADADYEYKSRVGRIPRRVGVAKVTVVKGRMPKSIA